MEYANLYNGVKMPMVGLGVMLTYGDECENMVREALDVGYRLFDTAKAYENEAAVGKAIAESGIAREDVFITSKIWITDAGYEKAKAAIEDSFKKLRTDYIDLFLIHMPAGDYFGTYRAFQEYYKEGRLRAIGVCNASPERLVDLALFNEIPPMVEQVETNVFFQQHELHSWMEKYHVQHEAWGPLAQERIGELVKHPLLNEIGAKYGKSASQIALKHSVQRGIVIIPKSSHRERMIQNIDLFDFTLSDEDMAAINALDEKHSIRSDYGNPISMEMIATELKGKGVLHDKFAIDYHK